MKWLPSAKLRSQGLTPLAVQDAEQAARTGMAQAVQTAAPTAAGAGFRPAKVRVDKSPVKSKDVLAFTSELAIMLRGRAGAGQRPARAHRDELQNLRWASCCRAFWRLSKAAHP